MSLISMDNEDFNKASYFDLLIQKKTYWTFLYSLLSIPINAFYFLFSLMGKRKIKKIKLFGNLKPLI